MKNANQRIVFRNRGMKMIQQYLELLDFFKMLDQSLPTEDDLAPMPSYYITILINQLLFAKSKSVDLKAWIRFLWNKLPDPEVLNIYMARQTISKSDPSLVFYDSKELNQIFIKSLKLLGISKQMDEDLSIDVASCELDTKAGKIRTTVTFSNKIPLYLQSCPATAPSWFNTNQVVYRTLEQLSKLEQSYTSIKFRADRDFYNVRIMGFLRKYRVNYFIEAHPKFYKHKIRSVKDWGVVANEPFKMEIGSFCWTTQGWHHRFVVARWRLDESLDYNVFCICTNDMKSTDKEVFQAYIGKDIVSPIITEMERELWGKRDFRTLPEMTIHQLLSVLVYLIFLSFRNFLVEEKIDGVTYQTTIDDLRNSVFVPFEDLNDSSQLLML